MHYSPLAGTWYPADKSELLQEIDACLQEAPERSLENLRGLVLPHAGYQWSGPTAAHGIRLLQSGRWDRAVVIGPSHRIRMRNSASIPQETHFATPLGEIPLDTAFLERLRSHRLFAEIPQAQHGEHSVQIELPFLQHALGDFQLVPIVVGQLDLPTIREMGAALGELLDSRTLVVASSDFTHYGWRFNYVPFRDQVPENLETLDRGAFDCIRAQDVEGFLDYIARTGATICGQHAIGVLMSALPAGAEAHLLHYDTSGRRGGDYTNSVSYLSIAFTASGGGAAPVEVVAAEQPFSHEEQEQLVNLARESLRFAVASGRPPTAAELGISPAPAIQHVAGAFVTWRKDGHLRGCVGEIQPTRPLYQAVMHQAVNAGLNDHRFAPVSSGEIDDLSVEISILTPPEPVASFHDIVLGEHGIILRKGHRGSVFLPKVAQEQGWGLEETLTHLARKAGLADDAWRSGATFQVFRAHAVKDASI